MSDRNRLQFQVGTTLYWMSLYFYVPILSVYAQEMGASLAVVGVMLSAYGVMQLLLRIPTGVASDLVGRRKPFVLAGLGLTVVGALGFWWAPAPWALVVARAITGMAATAWVAITVMFAGYYPAGEATSAIGMMGLTNGLGQAIATWAGGTAAGAYGWSAPFLLSTVAGVAGLGMMALCREAGRGPAGGAARAAAPVSWRRLWVVGTAPALLVVSGLSALNTYATFTTVYGFIPVYAHDLGASRGDLGTLTAISLVPFTLAQPLAAPLTRRLGFTATVAGALVLTGAMTLVVPLTHSFGTLAATQVGGGVGRGLLGTALMSLAVLSVAPPERATAMGVYQAVYATGMFLGPLLGGVIGEQAGLGAVFVSTGALCVGAGVAAALLLPRSSAGREAAGRREPVAAEEQSKQSGQGGQRAAAPGFS